MSANFPFQENIDVFAGEKAEKEYWIKINSKDATNTSPFNFNVKFNMRINNYNVDASGNQKGGGVFKKEAVIESNYTDIKKIEISDVIIPRYIPNNILGLNFDGVNLVQQGLDPIYFVSCYPGVTARCSTFTPAVGSPPSYPYIKLTSYKDCVILTSITSSPIMLDDISGSCFKYRDTKIIDHITIGDMVYPILDVSNNYITVFDYKQKDLPVSYSLIMANYYSNDVFETLRTNFHITSAGKNTSVSIDDFPALLLETMYASNIIRFYDSNNNNTYMILNKYTVVNTGTQITGTCYGDPIADLSGNIVVQLFNYGIRDMIDERIFYIEMDPFTPVKSSATDSSLDKMFGVLFPSTQSKNWLYCSGEPRESFLPRDLRKLDKITFTIYDSNGISINDTFKNRQGLLNPNYFSNMYTTVVLKVEEIDKTLVAKKNELKK